MTKNKKLIITISVTVCLLLILILGTIFDLQISKLLADLPNGHYYTSNIFAIIGECIGEDILYFIVLTACAILFFYLLNNPLQKKWVNYLLFALLIFISYDIANYLFYVTLDNFVPYVAGVKDYMSSTVGLVTIFIFPIFIVACVYLFVSRLKKETLKELWKWAVIVLIVSVVSNCIVQVAKHIFDRTRYRAMVFSGDEEFSYFTNWFVINNNKFSSSSIYADDFFKSFPSGHTCAGASTFLFVLLPTYYKKADNKRCKIIVWIVASVYTFLIALSRIIAGAHFFTDVYIAFLITTITILLTQVIFNNLSKKAVTNKNYNFDDETEFAK